MRSWPPSQALTRLRASLAGQEHGLLQAGGEWGEEVGEGVGEGAQGLDVPRGPAPDRVLQEGHGQDPGEVVHLPRGVSGSGRGGGRAEGTAEPKDVSWPQAGPAASPEAAGSRAGR